MPRNRANPSSTITASSTESVVYGPFDDWREPIRRDSIPLNTNVRITDSPQGKSRRPLSELRNDTSFTAPQMHGSTPPTAVSQQPSLSRRLRVSTRRSASPSQVEPFPPPPSLPSPITASPSNDRATPKQTFAETQELDGTPVHPSPTEERECPSLTHLPPTVPRFRPRFQPSSFVKNMKNSGRVYRNQATTLISLCRTFVQSQERNPDSDATLRL